MQLLKYLRVAHLTQIIAKALIFSFLLPFLSIPLTYADPGDETTYYFLNDRLGSVDVVLDDQGEVVERRDYLPYGQERYVHEELNAPETDQGFTGKELDDETGLNYYEARYYDSETGRFISPDPFLFRVDQMSDEEKKVFLSDPQNLNMYTYAKNNPVKYVDPDGEIAILAALVVATAFVATFMSSYQNVAAPDINSPPVHTRSEPEILASMVVAEVTGAIFGYGAGKAVQKVGQFGFKTIKQLKAYRKLVSEGVDAKVAAGQVTQSSNQKIANVKAKIKEYLGGNAKALTNEANGNVIFQSQDELREVRFDTSDPSPHQNVHTHVIEYRQTPQRKIKIDDQKAYPSNVNPE